MRRHAAFTLVEILIALALGLIAVYTLFAAMRLAVATFTAGTRLSRENMVMRQGFSALLEETDFWTLYDAPHGDPYDPPWNGQGLRQPPAVASASDHNTANLLGYPFTPVKDMAAIEEQVNPGSPLLARTTLLMPAGSQAAPAEFRRGIDDDPWSAADPKTWYRGNMTELANSDLRWGRYALLSHIRTDGAVLGRTTPEPRTISAELRIFPSGAYGTVAPLHHWRENQLLALRYGLGYYALMDYAPANTIYATHGRLQGGLVVDEDIHLGWYGVIEPTGTAAFKKGWRDSWLELPGQDAVGRPMSRAWGWGVMSILPRSRYARPDNNPVSTWTDDQVLLSGINGTHGSLRRAHHFTDNEETSDAEYYLALRQRRPLWFQKPDTWCDAWYGMMRYGKPGAWTNLGTLRWMSPVTGEGWEYSFRTFGTTLRGARQQRHRDGGWAEWRSPTDRDPTLDDP